MSEENCITVNVRLIKAACLCAAKNDLRKYINGVHIFTDEDNSIFVEGTDGSMLFRAQMARSDDKYSNPQESKLMNFTVPIDIAKQLAKMKTDSVTITKQGEEYRAGTYVFQPESGYYPDTNRLFYDEVADLPTEPVHFDFDRLAVLHNAIRTAIGKKVFTTLKYMPNSHGLMTAPGYDYVKCVICPLNKTHIDKQAGVYKQEENK